MHATRENYRRRIELKTLLLSRCLPNGTKYKNIAQYLAAEGLNQAEEYYRSQNKHWEKSTRLAIGMLGMAILVLISVAVASFLLNVAVLSEIAICLSLASFVGVIAWNIFNTNAREKWELLSEFVPFEPVLKAICECCTDKSD